MLIVDDLFSLVVVLLLNLFCCMVICWVFRWHFGFRIARVLQLVSEPGFRSVVIKLLKWHTVHSRWGWEIHYFRISIVMFHLLSKRDSTEAIQQLLTKWNITIEMRKQWISQSHLLCTVCHFNNLITTDLKPALIPTVTPKPKIRSMPVGSKLSTFGLTLLHEARTKV